MMEIIIGPMMSGKTSELIRRLRIESKIGFEVLYINHSIDNRSTNYVSTHDDCLDLSGIETIKTNNLTDIYNIVKNYDIIGIDESQFFNNLVDNVLHIVENLKKHVIITGLSGDFQRGKIGETLDLIPYTDKLTLLKAYCLECSKYKIRKEASFSHKKENNFQNKNNIDIGGIDKYIPVCRDCYLILNN